MYRNLSFGRRGGERLIGISDPLDSDDVAKANDFLAGEGRTVGWYRTSDPPMTVARLETGSLGTEIANAEARAVAGAIIVCLGITGPGGGMINCFRSQIPLLGPKDWAPDSVELTEVGQEGS